MTFHRYALGGALLVTTALGMQAPAFARIEISISCGAVGIEL